MEYPAHIFAPGHEGILELIWEASVSEVGLKSSGRQQYSRSRAIKKCGLRVGLPSLHSPHHTHIAVISLKTKDVGLYQSKKPYKLLCVPNPSPKPIISLAVYLNL